MAIFFDLNISGKIKFMVKLLIKEIAAQKGVSMRRLSKTSDITYRTIQRIYNDPDYMPTLPTLETIAKALGVSIAELIVEDPQG
ncbi:MAG TPA: helix-turn-helix transcriptional regulator [Ktedonobacteraceae bacterium]